jgi:hypothetical protein
MKPYPGECHDCFYSFKVGVFVLVEYNGAKTARTTINLLTAGIQLAEDIPNYDANDWTYAGGFVTEKAFEILAFKSLGNLENIRIRIPIYRVYGGVSRVVGFSWTPINPKLFSVSAFRRHAGLPNLNCGSRYIMVSVRIKDIIQFRSALPLDGNPGGLPEFIINSQNVNYSGYPGIFKSYWNK